MGTRVINTETRNRKKEIATIIAKKGLRCRWTAEAAPPVPNRRAEDAENTKKKKKKKDGTIQTFIKFNYG
jgi:hypothetical protein